jgi:predicted DNA-binding transcriptional regulator AlpA
MPAPTALLTAKEAAQFLRLRPATLAKYRSIGGRPDFTKLGGRVVYAREALEQWIAQCTVSSTAEYRIRNAHERQSSAIT